MRRAIGAALQGRRSYLLFMPVVLVHAFLVGHLIDLPGVYMDAVNPDYLVVKILNPGHERTIAWVLPGNYLFGHRFPLLVQSYQAAIPFYTGLPFYWLLGTTVEALRWTHGVYALVILGATAWVVRRSNVGPAAAALTCLALALDPSFTFAFRTQSYIALGNAIWLLLSLAWLLGACEKDAAEVRRAVRISGLLAGFACFSYFMFGFFLPALLGATLALAKTKRMPAGSLARTFIAAVLAGAFGYVWGYALIVGNTGGFSYFADQVTTLGVFASSLSIAGRIEYAWRMVSGVVSNAWHHSMIFGEWRAVPGSQAKILIVVGLTYLAWIVAEAMRIATFAQRLLVALPVSFFAVSLVFGNRLGGHHFSTLLPILYAGLAVGFANLLRAVSWRSRASRAAFTACFAALAALNVYGQVVERRELARVQGVGLYSNAIHRFADDLSALAKKPLVVFPDWGLALPVVFLTGGTVPTSTNSDAGFLRNYLCNGTDVAVALIHGDRAERAMQLGRDLAWDAPTVTPYRQASGQAVFDVVTFAGRRQGPGCG